MRIRVATPGDWAALELFLGRWHSLRFYQRRGFRLAALHRDAVSDSRSRLKPEIPEIGTHGIALHDELELEHIITPGS